MIATNVLLGIFNFYFTFHLYSSKVQYSCTVQLL